MLAYTSRETVALAINTFNRQACNAGLDFKVELFSRDSIYILASFNFDYYINVEIECREILYTNIKPDEKWPDAWKTDQIFLLSDEELQDLKEFIAIELNANKQYFGIVFNISGKENYFNSGTVICTSLSILWRNPVSED